MCYLKVAESEMLGIFSINELSANEKMVISFLMLFFDALKFKLNETNLNFLCNLASIDRRQLKKCLTSLKRKKVIKAINKGKLFFRLDFGCLR